MKELISIIVQVYNAEKHFNKCLVSKYEYLASTKQILERIDEYD